MRAVLIALLFLGMVFLSGCRKDPIVLFEIPQRLEFSVPAGLNPFDKHFFLVREVSNSLANLRDQFNVPEGQSLVIKPTQAIMTTQFQDTDLDFIDEVEISIFQEDPDLDQVAYLTDQVPFNASKNIVIIPFDTDFSSQLETGKLNYKVSLRLRTTTPTAFTAVINLNFGAE